jgi:hypothetical protein
MGVSNANSTFCTGTGTLASRGNTQSKPRLEADVLLQNQVIACKGNARLGGNGTVFMLWHTTSNH